MDHTLTKSVLVAAVLFTTVGIASAQNAQVAAGEKLYTTQKCAVCHSVAGVGNKKGPLEGVGARLSADEIRQWIVDAPTMTTKTKADRKPAMKGYPNLPKADVDALVAYVQSLKK